MRMNAAGLQTTANHINNTHSFILLCVCEWLYYDVVMESYQPFTHDTFQGCFIATETMI